MYVRSLDSCATLNLQGSGESRFTLSVVSWMKLAWATMAERHTLSKLTEDQLRDIGVDRLQAQNESERAPWDLPMDRLDS